MPACYIHIGQIAMQIIYIFSANTALSLMSLNLNENPVSQQYEYSFGIQSTQAVVTGLKNMEASSEPDVESCKLHGARPSLVCLQIAPIVLLIH